jgi:1,2-dihydroxy-3-keto-5-methylthiopentene dioxygenase
MSILRVYDAGGAGPQDTVRDHAEIGRRLGALGVQFERWQADRALAGDAGQEDVLAAYRAPIELLNRRHGFQSVDVVSLTPDHPKKDEMRQKFLNEHTHDDFEIRFFVDGSGLFYLHVGGWIYMVLCERGDLISVPADTTHWFDMGGRPRFKCIRFFTRPDGWVGRFTGSDIARRFPTFDQFVAMA